MVGSVLDTRVRPSPGRVEPRPWPSYTPPGALAVEGLRQTGCRWPIGEVHEDGFGFCNGPRLKGSYCQAHHALAYRGVAL